MAVMATIPCGGGSADDVLIGGDGNNRFSGGLGADTFGVGFDGVDIIEDFNEAEGDIVRLNLDQLPAARFGSEAAARNALNYNNATGVLSFDNNQIARLIDPQGGFSVDRVEFI